MCKRVYVCESVCIEVYLYVQEKRDSKVNEDEEKYSKKKRETYQIPSSRPSFTADHIVQGLYAYHVDVCPKPHSLYRSRDSSTITCTSHSPPTSMIQTSVSGPELWETATQRISGWAVEKAVRVLKVFSATVFHFIINL